MSGLGNRWGRYRRGWHRLGGAAAAAALLLGQPAGAAAAPTVAAKAPVAAAPAPAPRPAIWLLEDADTKIYLFGTIHILPPGFKWRSAALDKVVAGADELVVETYVPPGQEAAEDEELFRLFLLEKPSPILERVPAAKRDALKEAIEASLLPAETFDEMQTWAAAILLGLAQLLGEYGVEDPDAAAGVEDVLEEAFRKANKPIGSVEDALGVLRDMNALPAATQSEMLVQALVQPSDAKRIDDGINAAWAAGQAERMEIAKARDLPAAMYEVLLTKRNAAWTQWLVKRLERPGTVLFAVGAGHLAGPDSVQNMLAKAGLAARRID